MKRQVKLDKRLLVEVKENRFGDLEIDVVEKSTHAKINSELKSYYGKDFDECQFYLQREIDIDFFWQHVNARKRSHVQNGHVAGVWIDTEILNCLSSIDLTGILI